MKVSVNLQTLLPEGRVAIKVANACKITACTGAQSFELAVRALNLANLSFLSSHPSLKYTPSVAQIFHTKAMQGFLFSITDSLLEYVIRTKTFVFASCRLNGT
jgi:hypothetical protein